MLSRLTLFLHRHELASMPEYSRTIPSATTVGKFWKQNLNQNAKDPRWVVCCYAEHEDPKLIRVLYFDVEILEGPVQSEHVGVDWSNYSEWKRERARERAIGR